LFDHAQILEQLFLTRVLLAGAAQCDRVVAIAAAAAFEKTELHATIVLAANEFGAFGNVGGDIIISRNA